MAEKVPGIKLEVEADNSKLQKGLVKSEKLLEKLGKSADAQKVKIGGVAGAFAAVTGAMSTVEGVSKGLSGIFKGMNGDVEGMLDTFETLPAGVGPAIAAVRGLWNELSGAADEAKRLADEQERAADEAEKHAKHTKDVADRAKKIDVRIAGAGATSFEAQAKKINDQLAADLKTLNEKQALVIEEATAAAAGEYDKSLSKFVAARDKAEKRLGEIRAARAQFRSFTTTWNQKNYEIAIATAKTTKEQLAAETAIAKTKKDVRIAEAAISLPEIEAVKNLAKAELGLVNEAMVATKDLADLEARRNKAQIKHSTKMAELQRKGESTLLERAQQILTEKSFDAEEKLYKLRLDAAQTITKLQKKEIAKIEKQRSDGVKITKEAELEALGTIYDTQEKLRKEAAKDILEDITAHAKLQESLFSQGRRVEKNAALEKEDLTKQRASNIHILRLRLAGKEFEARLAQEDELARRHEINVKKQVEALKAQSKPGILLREQGVERRKLVRDLHTLETKPQPTREEHGEILELRDQIDNLDTAIHKTERALAEEMQGPIKALKEFLDLSYELKIKIDKDAWKAEVDKQFQALKLLDIDLDKATALQKPEAREIKLAQIDYLSALDRGKAKEEPVVDELVKQTEVLIEMNRAVKNINLDRLR